MDKKELLTASIDQIETFYNSQFIRWHLTAVESIRKILLNLDDFYNDIISNIEYEDETADIVHCQIRNGWFCDAVAHAEQAIEDLFSVIMNFKELETFTKDVLYYNAGKVVKFIRAFDSDNLKSLSEQMGYRYFPIDENDPGFVEWDDKDTYEKYRASILLTQSYFKELQEFHKRYYDDYCQYKHGLTVALAPMQNQFVKDDVEIIKKIKEYPLKGGICTFHNGTIGDYQKRTGVLPAVMLQLKPGIQPHISELHRDGNLLFSTMHSVDINEVKNVVKHACILLNVVWQNHIKRCDINDNDKTLEVVYPMDSIKRFLIIEHDLI